MITTASTRNDRQAHERRVCIVMQNPLPDHDVACVAFVISTGVQIAVVFRERCGGDDDADDARRGSPGRCICLAVNFGLAFKTHQRLLVLLLPLPLDVELLFLAPKLRRSLSFELVPVDRKGVVDGDRVTSEIPHC